MSEKATVTGRVSEVMRHWDAGQRRALRIELRRWVRRARSQLHGTLAKLRYQRTYGHPDLDVTADVLADRIRSSLGPLELRLDIPHVHVMVEGKTALLHGDVGTRADAAAIVAAVGAVLTVFIRRLPPVEAQHVLGHLPSDVRVLVHRNTWLPVRRLRTVDQLVWNVTVEADHLPLPISEPVTRSVLATLRSLVPDEGTGVTKVLPERLRPLWAADTTYVVPAPPVAIS